MPVGEKYTEHLKELVRSAGKELIRRADDLVGDGDLITDFDIWIKFPPDEPVPKIEVTREYLTKEAIDIFLKEDKQK